MNKNQIIEYLKKHFWGPVGSVLLHVIVIFLLLVFVQFATKEQAPEVEVEIAEPEQVELEEPEEIEKEIEEVELTDVDIEMPDVESYTDTPTPENLEVDATLDSIETDAADFDAVDIVSDMKSPLVMKGLFSGRSASGRAQGLRQYGGRYGQAIEAAVIKALEWLRDHQLPDGSWEKNMFL
ncbi:MAG: hypothetical protein GKR87_10105 [Kiritimatiellae bacterium]|nr:hypothetical protein [Kiritimatiellia bacterium]